jgi:hypothetical protein
VRRSRAGAEKSSGARVIYFSRLSNGETWLLTMYAKSARNSIAAEVLRKLKEFINGKDEHKGAPKDRERLTTARN